MNNMLTTAEQLEQWRRLTRWVLWKMATDSVEVSAEARAAAQRLFNDTGWVGNTVGRFAANYAAGELADTRDWAEFASSTGA